MCTSRDETSQKQLADDLLALERYSQNCRIASMVSSLKQKLSNCSLCSTNTLSSSIQSFVRNLLSPFHFFLFFHRAASALCRLVVLLLPLLSQLLLQALTQLFVRHQILFRLRSALREILPYTSTNAPTARLDSSATRPSFE